MSAINKLLKAGLSLVIIMVITIGLGSAIDTTASPTNLRCDDYDICDVYDGTGDCFDTAGTIYAECNMIGLDNCSTLYCQIADDL